MEKDLAQSTGNEELRTLSTHAHSVFLQTWFELGLVGATLLTLFGLALVQSIMALGAAVRPYALATFASTAVMAASSYGMWQYWYLAMFGLCAATFGVGARLLEDRTGAPNATRQSAG
jgi:O-antigen ligase